MKTKYVLIVLAALLFAAIACNTPGLQDDTELPEVTIPQPADTDTASTDEGAADVTDELQDTPTQGLTDETQTPDATATEEETETPQATDRPSSGEGPAFGDEIYSTNFSTGWVEVTSSDGDTVRGRATPANGGLLFEVDASWGLWVYTQRDDIDQFYAETIATPQSCPASGSSYGLMFQFRDNDNFRAFAVTCSNEYELTNFAETGDRVLATGDLPATINAASGRHTLGVLAKGTTLTLYVDDTEIDSVQVDDMPAGDFGPFVDTATEAITVLFEEMSLYEPE